jgi:SAM-dependent methyltransferase
MSEQKYYAADEQYKEELARLRLQETYFDPQSFRRFETIGVGKGWNCLEVGAGTGSVAEWLAKRVGPNGKVVATDINPRFMQDLKVSNIEIRRHDILKDEMEKNKYDLVHCRAVLVHLSEPEKALKRMVEAARPGAWILVEEPDYGSVLSTDITDSASAPFVATIKASFAAMRKSRIMDPYFGRRLLPMVEQLGLIYISQDGWTRIAHGGDAPAKVNARNLQIMSKKLIESGAITQEQFDIAIRLLNDPAFVYLGYTGFGVWGRKPLN